MCVFLSIRQVSQSLSISASLLSLYTFSLFSVRCSRVFTCPLLQAVLHFFFAALGGHVGAQMAMGYRHWNGGLGVPKNCSKAVRFYEMAANKVQ